jgi:hypothetical protein
VPGKMEKLDIEARFAVVPADNDLLHVVVKDFGGHPAKRTESAQVAIHEDLHCAAFNELDVHGPGETKNHDEGVDRGGLSRTVINLEIAPIDLGLETRLCLEAGIGDPAFLLFD